MLGTVLSGTPILGLGLPFLAVAAVYDRALRLLSPLLRDRGIVSLIGGLRVAFIRIAMVLDWLSLLALHQLQHGNRRLEAILP